MIVQFNISIFLLLFIVFFLLFFKYFKIVLQFFLKHCVYCNIDYRRLELSVINWFVLCCAVKIRRMFVSIWTAKGWNFHIHISLVYVRPHIYWYLFAETLLNWIKSFNNEIQKKRTKKTNVKEKAYCLCMSMRFNVLQIIQNRKKLSFFHLPLVFSSTWFFKDNNSKACGIKHVQTYKHRKK